MGHQRKSAATFVMSALLPRTDILLRVGYVRKELPPLPDIPAVLVGCKIIRFRPSRLDLPRLRRFVGFGRVSFKCYSADIEMTKIGTALVMIAALLGGVGKV